MDKWKDRQRTKGQRDRGTKKERNKATKGQRDKGTQRKQGKEMEITSLSTKGQRYIGKYG